MVKRKKIVFLYEGESCGESLLSVCSSAIEWERERHDDPNTTTIVQAGIPPSIPAK